MAAVMTRTEKLWLKMLTSSVEQRNQTISVWSLIRRSWRRYAVLLSLLAVEGFVLYPFNIGFFAVAFALLVGIVLGIFWADLGRFRMAVQLSPLSNEIADWDKIQAKIDELKAKQST